MFIRRVPGYFFAAFIALAALVAVLGSLQAQVVETVVEFEVIAGSLSNPRGLAFSPDGSLYIAEAGTGGNGACIPGPDGEQCYGTSGAVTKVTFDAEGNVETQQQVATGFASLGAKDTGDNATGPNDITFTSTGDMYVLMGLGADPAVRDPSGPLGSDGINFGQLVGVDSGGSWSNEVDVAAFEASDNPDGAQIDSNPFALLAVGETFKVVDAGGNSLLNVDMTGSDGFKAATADISTIAVFPATPVEFPPGSGQMIPLDAVPSAVEIGPDGAYYVSQLTGFPFPLGGASIFRVVPGEDPQIYLSGFTNVLDLAWGPDGSLFVLEMARDSLGGDPPPVGQIIQVTPYGARSVIASDGLIAPVDMEIGPDHALYVINFGPMGNSGQVLRIPLPSSTAVLPASKDNTLYESETGMLSNGVGQHVFAGVTGGKVGNLQRRGLVAFDLQSTLPDGATIISATLELNMSRTAVGEKSISLHKVDKSWGEGASDAAGEEGAGATAAEGDATWMYTYFNTGMWDTAGGDFDAAPSAATTVGAVGQYSWSSAKMTADLQGWLDDSESSHGWLLKGDESGGASAKRFDSREHSDAANHPNLTVTYIVPLPKYAVFAPLVSAAD